MIRKSQSKTITTNVFITTLINTTFLAVTLIGERIQFFMLFSCLTDQKHTDRRLGKNMLAQC